MNWKDDIYTKFSPILGMEKTEELVLSIEEVYGHPEKYEDALTIINYLIELSEDNSKNNNDLLLKLKIINTYLIGIENINIFYKITSLAVVITLFFIANIMPISIFGFLIGLLVVPMIYEIFLMHKNKGEF